MPSSLQAQITRSAISPRLATRIFWNMGWAPLLFAARMDAEEGLPVFDRLPILHKNAQHLAADVGLDFVHQLHSFHDAQRLPGFYVAADFYKRLRTRTRRPIVGAHNRRLYQMQLFGRTRLRR